MDDTGRQQDASATCAGEDAFLEINAGARARGMLPEHTDEEIEEVRQRWMRLRSLYLASRDVPE